MKDYKKVTKRKDRKLSRRNFISNVAATATFTIVPRHVLGGNGYTPPSGKLNIACIGVGGNGWTTIKNINTESIVALCDVDESRAAKTFSEHPKARKYRDFRKMLEKEEKNIDAATVCTPDHTHAVASMTAIKLGKHLFGQKPLAHDIFEVRQLTEAARRHKVVTQMGIQHHASNGTRILVEMIKSGVIGKVREVHVWCSKTYAYGEGTDRPKEAPPVPATLDWDLWLGPAPKRPYHTCYLPFNWRIWWDFGTGNVGDMACHLLDSAFWALGLGSSFTVEAQTSPFGGEIYPVSSIIRYEFPGRDELPPVTVTWYDGGMMPWRPKEFEQERNFSKRGSLFVGEKGKIIIPLGGGPRLIPESKMKGFKPPEPFLPRNVDHYQEWIQACKGGPKPSANFDYAGPLTEMALLANIAIRTGKKLIWNGPNMKITNIPEANEYLRREYRQGWTL